MNRVIYKYPIKIDDEITIHTGTMPIVRHVGYQGSQLCAWIEHDQDEPAAIAKLIVRGTGQPFDVTSPPTRFITTIQDGPFVWHFHQVLR